MVPIHELLSRIRWDRDFGQGSFEVGYLDHLRQRIVRVPFKDIHFEGGNNFSFDLYDEEGALHTIPFHRVREVYRNGSLIWQRPH